MDFGLVCNLESNRRFTRNAINHRSIAVSLREKKLMLKATQFIGIMSGIMSGMMSGMMSGIMSGIIVGIMVGIV